MTMKSIVDWFDPKNLTHLQAYQHLQNVGLWPEHFIPADVGFPNLWQVALAGKLADLYVSEKIAWLSGKVLRDVDLTTRRR